MSIMLFHGPLLGFCLILGGAPSLTWSSGLAPAGNRSAVGRVRPARDPIAVWSPGGMAELRGPPMATQELKTPTH